MQDIGWAFQLMLVGLLTVFGTLLLFMGMINLLNKFFPPEEEPATDEEG